MLTYIYYSFGKKIYLGGLKLLFGLIQLIGSMRPKFEVDTN